MAAANREIDLASQKNKVKRQVHSYNNFITAAIIHYREEFVIK